MTGNSSINIDTSVTSFWQAWLNFRAGKRPTKAIDAFETNLEINLLRLVADVHHKTYTHGSYQRVVIAEKKRRDLAVSSVRDRVVHRLVYDYLVQLVDPRLDYDVWSCRPGKGLHGALQRTQSLLRSYPDAVIWRADIRKFFDHVQQDQLMNVIAKHTTNPQAIWLCQQITDSYNGLSKQASKQARYTDWQFNEPNLRQCILTRV